MNRCRLFIVAHLAGVPLWFAVAQGPSAPTTDPLLTQDELALKAAGIATDGASLLDYFRKRTPSEAEQALLKQRAAQLGSSAFTARTQATDFLIKKGRASLPFLRDIARKADAETARRAQYAIDVIERNTKLSLSANASRVLAERKPVGALETLLAYAPFVDESWVEDEIRQSIKRIAYTDGKALVIVEQALTDKEPKRRAAAAWIAGASTEVRQRKLAIERLRDESSEVRLLAATALLASHEPTAVPALIDLLTTDSSEQAWRAEELLFRLAGEHGPPVWLNPANDNSGRKVQLAWDAWWKVNEAKVDWKSLQLDEQSLGFTLIVENQRPDGGSRIYETNHSGQIRFEVKIRNPIDAQWLPGGRLLVGDSRDSLIYEMDSRGIVGWKHSGIAPTSLQRLPNGNTVASTYQNIIELTREGKIVFKYATQGHTYHARKTPDGHYIWIDACGEIGEVDGDGKVMHKVKVGASLSWGSIERLRNGRFLIALGGGSGMVQEVDMAGKVYWQKAVNNPNRAVRLANGNTLVASHSDAAIYEFDPNGNERWKHACVGRPFAALRR